MVKKSKKKAAKTAIKAVKKYKKPAKKAAKAVKRIQKAVKKVVKKAVKKTAVKAQKQAAEQPQEKEIGIVTHYFTDISVAVIKLSSTLRIGDEIHVKGATSDFKQRVDSMQVEHEQIKEAKAGQSIGLKVVDHAREHDMVYKV